MSRNRVAEAAYNNAVLCDSVCRAHGLAGEFAPGIWINRHQVPQFYPNAVTFSEEADSASILRSINELVASAVPAGLAIKDSFSALELNSLGFEVLFTAQWIYRPASMPLARSPIDGVRWIKIENPKDLMRWEDAWRGESVEAPSRIFMPQLLQDPAFAVMAAYRAEKIVAGVIANRSGDVVGISNVFAPAGEEYEFGIEGLASVMEKFPGLAVVGYEDGPALELARRLGFEAIGGLRVWIQREPSSNKQS
jgi:hypothetical protein